MTAVAASPDWLPFAFQRVYDASLAVLTPPEIFKPLRLLPVKGKTQVKSMANLNAEKAR